MGEARKFKPLQDRVLIRRLDQEEKAAGGIIISDTDTPENLRSL
jgi:co-chaperonin GroES (HSP10)